MCTRMADLRLSQVVPLESAVVPGYNSAGIHAHHKDIARFQSEDSPGYRSLVAEIQRWMSDVTVNRVEERYDDKTVAELARGSDDATLQDEGTQESPSQLARADAKSTGRRYKNELGEIIIRGNVVKSSIVLGHQTINGDLYFS
jgi:hypothetical protein